MTYNCTDPFASIAIKLQQELNDALLENETLTAINKVHLETIARLRADIVRLEGRTVTHAPVERLTVTHVGTEDFVEFIRRTTP
jgi:hypothetical protein